MRWMVRTTKGILVGLIVCFSVVLATQTAHAGDPPFWVLAVDLAATGGDDGTRWEDAYTNLQDALDDAEGDPTITEIWVAAGEYKPSKPFCLFCEPEELTERHNTFKLIDGVGIYGGFLGTALGGGEDQLSQRNPERNSTVLSGDLGALGDPDDNAYHPVVGDTVGATAILSGFIITAGNANLASGLAGLGGGMALWHSGPTVTRCSFTDNWAIQGGGVWLGVTSADPEPYFVNCLFAGNDAGSRGGGAKLNGGGHAYWVNCTFLDNEAGLGGAIAFTPMSDGTLVNCTVVANSAGVLGGGIQSHSDNVGGNATIITNCIFWGNEDAGGMDESAQIDVVFDQFFTVTYSCIQGCDDFCDDPGDNNIDDDPEFSDPVSGNYRLLDGSPCIDAASDAGVPDDEADVDDNGDTLEQLPWDLDTRVRIFDAIGSTTNDVDMGAYEFQPCPWDIDADCEVGAFELVILLASWGPCADCNNCWADFDGNCTVGASDLLELLANWGSCSCDDQSGSLSLEEELALHCLDMVDWVAFVAVMTDPNSSQADKDNYLCWMLHYLEDCSKCFCTGQSGCPGPDPFN